jgi:UDP-glucose 4-epimerase
LIEADVRDGKRVLDVLRSHRIECVLHFAALAYVGESVDKPLYYDNTLPPRCPSLYGTGLS